MKIKQMIEALRKKNIPLTVMSKATGISYTRLYNASTKRPSRFHESEERQIVEFYEKAICL